MNRTSPGEHIGDYRIESVLGRGGMGVVYRVVDLTTGTSYALKTVGELREAERLAAQLGASAEGELGEAIAVLRDAVRVARPQ